MDKYAIGYECASGIQYLTGIETHCCGKRLVGWYSPRRSSAMPFSQNQAIVVCDMLRETGIRRLKVFPYPVKDPDPVSDLP